MEQVSELTGALEAPGARTSWPRLPRMSLRAVARRVIPTSLQTRPPFQAYVFGFYSAEMTKSHEPRFRVLLSGRVQGVGFRVWATRRALELGLSGWVRNCRDGSVEVQAAGPLPALHQFRQLLEDGPPLAHVLRVQEEPPYADPLPESFEIR